MATIAIRPWGNSHGIRLSKELMQRVGITAEDLLEMDVRDGMIILRKQVQRKTLPEYAAEYGGTLGPYEEFDWGSESGEDGIGIGRWLYEGN